MTQFLYISQLSDFGAECNVELEKFNSPYSCQFHLDYIDTHYSFMNALYKINFNSNLDFQKYKLRKITLNFNKNNDCFLYYRILYIQVYTSSRYLMDRRGAINLYDRVTDLKLEYNRENNIFIDTYSIKKLENHFNERCVDVETPIYIEDKPEVCFHDCLNAQINQTFGCLLINNNNWNFINIEKDINELGYKYCIKDHSKSSQKIFKHFNHCKKQCQPNCNIIDFNVYNILGKKSLNNSMIVNIIPKYGHQMNLIEIRRWDVWDLFYNMGGIIGIWIGWSVISVSSLMMIIVNQYKRLIKLIKPFIIIFFNKLKLILRKTLFPLKTVFKYIIKSIVKLITKLILNIINFMNFD
jgi:hypothetical protein